MCWGQIDLYERKLPLNPTLERILEVNIALVRTLAILFIGIRAGAGVSALGMETFTPLALATPGLGLAILAMFPYSQIWGWIEDWQYRKQEDVPCSEN
jgi:hypothetical protein